MTPSPDADHDELALLAENAAEIGMPADRLPPVERGAVRLASGQSLSYLRWGVGAPEAVLLHGGAQNAHTWDTTAVALGRPLVAFDLPGHGHSDRRDDRDYGPWRNAEAVAEALDALGVAPDVVVGMSLGGVTAIRLAAERPDLVPRLVVVDVTPQVNDPRRSLSTAERGTVALLAGAPIYASLDEMVDAAVALSPNRPASAVARGVRHNAVRGEDGLWRWRHDLFTPAPEGAPQWHDFTPLWDDVSRLEASLLVVRGGASAYVTDDDVAELERRKPGARVAVVDGAGHAVQSDRPLDLAGLVGGTLEN